MKWKRLSLGPLQTNGFVIYNESNKALMVDPGGDDEKLLKWLQSEGLSVAAVILTHAHFDHIGAVEAVRQTFDCPVYIHRAEAEWLTKPELNGSGLFMGIEPISCRPADFYYEKEGAVEIEGFECELYETPGHSPGSVSFYFPDNKVVFSGDVLFRGGVGRTDLPGGDQETLMNTIHNVMLNLPDDTIVANGHGPETTIGEEKETNPFINGFGW
ncbi:MBL fold metallo-hydrolase [Salipaludibacillus sp. CUR1]|uniref:MBL fold metallo-hydrolase n=1 Tax=Salipaludibacillus sp. CUR1 TaxID=2820003 RepID=UPI001E5F39CF|nr:MBL fold metallo-hydrolase [Salipaludibacillus sp. CUR1]MCE7794285.1 MBL fold metallo-hydrolase [Salipaludibacillus sp. CUR1]